MKAFFSACALVALVALAGCAGGPMPAAPPAEMAPLPHAPVRGGLSGGVFNAEAVPLTSDSRAFRAGDVVTVILQETTQASKRAGTQVSKDASVGIAPAAMLGKVFPKSAVELSAERSFSGDATSTQQNALTGALTVVVEEVLANGLLRVSGEKSLTLNQGEEFVRLSGFLRAADIDADNRVSSLRVANARIAYSGRGALAESNSPGWLSRFFLGPWMPF
jgi:flagellar L-ring protein precursor FlgH